jgi:RNA polymerase sigma factor (sigma-70 family)
MQTLPTIRRDRRRPSAGTDRRPESRSSPTRDEHTKELSMANHCRRLRTCVARAASSLTPAEREILVLSARDGLSNSQIAERLGISAEEAERRLASALVRFERALWKAQHPWRGFFKRR